MKMYKILEDDQVYSDVDDVLDWCVEDEYYENDENDFECWVNEHYSGVDICGVYYEPYDIVNNADDGNLRDLRTEYCEYMIECDRERFEYDLLSAEVGEIINVNNYTVEVYEDETGDFDGDEIFPECNSEDDDLWWEKENQHEVMMNEQENEKDLMSIFQRIGG